MICKVCLGKGWILNENYTERIECPACHGTKETDPTNEDWFCSLSTEEKAKRIINIAFGVVGTCHYCKGSGYLVESGRKNMTEQEYIQTCTTEQLAEFLCNVAVTDVLWDKIRQPYYTDGKQAVMEWLKQPHTEKE